MMLQIREYNHGHRFNNPIQEKTTPLVVKPTTSAAAEREAISAGMDTTMNSYATSENNVDVSSSSYDNDDSIVDARMLACNFFTLKDKCTVEACTMSVTGESPLGDEGWYIAGRMDALGGQAVLFSGEKKMLAAIVRQNNGYQIFSPKPVYPNQEPEKDRRIRKKKVYLWATVDQKRFSNKLNIWVERSPSLEVEVSGKFFGSYSAKIIEKTTKRPCGKIRHRFEKGNVTESQWEILKLSSQSPQMMICIAAIINRSMGRIVYDDNHI